MASRKYRKARDRLNARGAAYDRLISGNDHEIKVQTRINTGGFRRPGSMQK